MNTKEAVRSPKCSVQSNQKNFKILVAGAENKKYIFKTINLSNTLYFKTFILAIIKFVILLYEIKITILFGNQIVKSF